MPGNIRRLVLKNEHVVSRDAGHRALTAAARLPTFIKDFFVIELSIRWACMCAFRPAGSGFASCLLLRFFILFRFIKDEFLGRWL